ncbi:hypothetical protein FSP39_019345 [Pinctada imbricata]|uniref:Uncharacterized protein n=1 Tax=Pinctada imbricata TaxID=66713 RepID=A0AA88YKP6_PINIB|nr:hypothetical protein FSP39_019345 [Pinctada imbricata]
MLKLISTISKPFCRQWLPKQIQRFIKTGHPQADKELEKATGGRIDQWIKLWENFIGLTPVKEAQAVVIQVSITSARRALCRVVPKKRKVDTASLKVETLSATSRSPECEPALSLDEMPESNSSDDSLTQLEDAESPSKAELKQKNLSLLHLRSKEKFPYFAFVTLMLT